MKSIHSLTIYFKGDNILFLSEKMNSQCTLRLTSPLGFDDRKLVFLCP